MPNDPAPQGRVDLSDSPANLDTATFDSLFPAEPTTTVTPLAQPTASPEPAKPVVQAQPVQPTTQEPFLKGERSVYNTAEAATQGINQKDALIEQLRQRYALTTGVDPITNQPVGPSSQPVSDNYYENPKVFMDSLFNAAKTSPEAYRDVLAKFNLDTLAPLKPLMERMAREQAVETLATSLPEAKTFVGTPTYQKALEANPELKSAISIAESDFKWHSRLPELYKLAYYTGQGMQMPELLAAARTTPQPAPTQTTTQPVRTTVQPTTQALPTANTARPTLQNIQGIRAIIADAEARGAKLEF